MTTPLIIATRFRGPARSGNGGWTAGSLAEQVPAPGGETAPTIEVTLRQPPPLEVALDVETLPADAVTGGPLTVLTFGGSRIAEAREVDAVLDPVEAVEPAAAEAAMSRYAGLRSHPFPGCFACGTDRAEGDGLRIFPGPVDGPDTVASLWRPDPSLAEVSDLLDDGIARVGVAATWAALDCVGGWSEDLEGRPSVLGRMTARVDALPVVGETHVVVGRRLRSDGRKTFTASTLYDADGRVVATAAHVWVAVDPSVFN
ncbi:MAG: hypothetical protein ACXVWU_13580 [Nocardioides sp.]